MELQTDNVASPTSDGVAGVDNRPTRHLDPYKFRKGMKRSPLAGRQPLPSFLDVATSILREPNRKGSKVTKWETLLRRVIERAMHGDKCATVELLARIAPIPKGDRANNAARIVVNMIAEGAAERIQNAMIQGVRPLLTKDDIGASGLAQNDDGVGGVGCEGSEGTPGVGEVGGPHTSLDD